MLDMQIQMVFAREVYDLDASIFSLLRHSFSRTLAPCCQSTSIQTFQSVAYRYLSSIKIFPWNFPREKECITSEWTVDSIHFCEEASWFLIWFRRI